MCLVRYLKSMVFNTNQTKHHDYMTNAHTVLLYKQTLCYLSISIPFSDVKINTFNQSL